MNYHSMTLADWEAFIDKKVHTDKGWNAFTIERRNRIAEHMKRQMRDSFANGRKAETLGAR